MMGRLRWLYSSARLYRLLFQRRFDEAIVYARQALELSSDNSTAFYWLGRAYYGQKNFLSAYWCFETSWRSGQNRPLAVQYFLGICAFEIGRYDLARKTLLNFCQSSTFWEQHCLPSISMAKGTLLLGYACIKVGEFKEGIFYLEKVAQAGVQEQNRLKKEIQILKEENRIQSKNEKTIAHLRLIESV